MAILPHPSPRGMIRFREMGELRGWEVIESLCASAQPAGRVVRYIYEMLRDEILDDLKNAMPVDAVLLDLHGAMAANGYDDCEGDMLKRIRDIVGPEVPIGASLDPHCHMTQTMLENATALIAAKEYPIPMVECRKKTCSRSSYPPPRGELNQSCRCLIVG